MFDLSGMTALVTGASGGLGSAIAKALAAQGARLAVSGSNLEKLTHPIDGIDSDLDRVTRDVSSADALAVDEVPLILNVVSEGAYRIGRDAGRAQFVLYRPHRLRI